MINMLSDKAKDRIAYSFMIVGFILLNYMIIGYGHSMLYNPDVYVCRHMSRDIEDQLESFGIPVVIIRASNHNNSEAHMWVKILGVDFDSVSLTPYLFGYTNKRAEFADYQDYLDSRKT